MAGNPHGVRNCATKVFVMWVNAFSHWNETSAGTHLHAQRTLSITPVGEHTRFAWKQLRLPLKIVDYGGLLRPLSLHWQLSDLATESRSFTNCCVFSQTNCNNKYSLQVLVNESPSFHHKRASVETIFTKKRKKKIPIRGLIIKNSGKWPRSRPLLTWYAENKIGMKNDQ